jgi:hypothetical protein
VESLPKDLSSVRRSPSKRDLSPDEIDHQAENNPSGGPVREADPDGKNPKGSDSRKEDFPDAIRFPLTGPVSNLGSTHFERLTGLIGSNSLITRFLRKDRTQTRDAPYRIFILRGSAPDGKQFPGCKFPQFDEYSNGDLSRTVFSSPYGSRDLTGSNSMTNPVSLERKLIQWESTPERERQERDRIR